MAEREIDREIDRKKKEQESAEAISGLKKTWVFFSNSLLTTSFLFLKDEVVIGGIYWNVGYVDQKLDMSLIHHNIIFI